jgi:vitamin B12 transporter
VAVTFEKVLPHAGRDRGTSRYLLATLMSHPPAVLETAKQDISCLRATRPGTDEMTICMKMAGATALCLATTFAAAQAQPTAGVDDTTSEATMLETLFVTDGIAPVDPRRTGRAFTVITGEELERERVGHVADALRRVPGFAVSRMGGIGGQTQIRVRGAEANHVLVLIDGVNVSETSTGEFDFGSLLVGEVDRIEVLRGPQSAFWGSNAMAGVVNIITRRGSRDGIRTSVQAETGTDGTYLGGVSVSGGRDDFDLSLSGILRHTDGFNISDFGHEKDGDRNASLNGNFTFDATPDLTLDGTFRFVDRASDIDRQDYGFSSPTEGLVIDTNDRNETREFFGSLGAQHVSLGGALTQKARFLASDTFRETFTDGAADTTSDGNRYNATYQASYQFDTPSTFDGSHVVSGGYEWQRETFLPSHLNERFRRESNSFIAEYRGEFLDQFYLNAALRHDLNDRFSDATTYSLGSAWAIPGTATRLHASVGTGVTNPTFFEQFGFIPESFVGNAGLTPEKSTGFDIGVEQALLNGALVVDVTYFNQDLTNEIATLFGGAPDFLATVVNRSGRSKRQGVELAATYDFENGFSATASYTYTDATEQTETGGERQREVRRPRHSGSIGAAYTFHDDRARIFGEVVFNGRTEDLAFVPDLPARVTLDDYQIVNIGGSYRFSETIEAYGRVENLFDADYEEVFGYNTQGLTGFVGLKGSF